MERVILHSDANAFYASVECVLHPELKGRAMAVCGSQESRHGIVLAKSELAKRAGVKTGMANWQAKKLCPDLVIVPPHHEIYARFSARLREIYGRYTDRVEPYGLDECWLDVSGSLKTGRAIADELRAAAKGELGLTVSVGVSFNKVFAKLGSDLKKPDAVTEITKENFKEKVWKLPCSDLLYCGRATSEKLARAGVKTIGALAAYPEEGLKRLFGKNGEMLWRFANGLDDSPVALAGEEEQAKSIGHGITCVSDLENGEEAKVVLIALAQDIGRKLRTLGLRAHGVQVTVRNSELGFESWQKPVPPTQCASVLAKEGYGLLSARYGWEKKIRALTLAAIRLEGEDSPAQLSLFEEEGDGKQRRVEGAVDKIREKFGADAIKPAALLGENKMPEQFGGQAKLPGGMRSPKKG